MAIQRFLLLLITSTLISACTEFPTRQLQTVKVIGYVPAREEGHDWAAKKTVYAHWIYENVSTGERFIDTTKFGEIGEVIKIRR